MEISKDLIKRFNEATNYELWYDDDEEFSSTYVVTRDTLQDFLNSTPAIRSGYFKGELGGFKYIGWETFQARKGDTRTSVSIVDFGEHRLYIETDVSLYDFSPK